MESAIRRRESSSRGPRCRDGRGSFSWGLSFCWSVVVLGVGFRSGVGVGWSEPEFAALGVPFSGAPGPADPPLRPPDGEDSTRHVHFGVTPAATSRHSVLSVRISTRKAMVR